MKIQLIRLKHIGGLFVLLALLAGCAGLNTPARETTTSSEQIASPPAITRENTQPPALSAVVTGEASRDASPPETQETQQTGLLDLQTLLAMFSEPPQAQGEVLLLYGRVLDASGDPLAGAAVEIWQTDSNGIYDHPNAPNTSQRDPAFQGYGTSITAEAGWYVFRTLRPAAYANRPPHIHLKVKIDGQEVLTSQFYFATDREIFEGEGIFAQAGEQGEMLVLDPQWEVDVSGIPVLVAQKDIVVDTGRDSGTLTLTPAQTEGPYYPVVPVNEYDHDLLIPER
jgi:protocatechuate 3,4-dioxygenase beta subunit